MSSFRCATLTRQFEISLHGCLAQPQRGTRGVPGSALGFCCSPASASRGRGGLRVVRVELLQHVQCRSSHPRAGAVDGGHARLEQVLMVLQEWRFIYLLTCLLGGGSWCKQAAGFPLPSVGGRPPPTLQQQTPRRQGTSVPGATRPHPRTGSGMMPPATTMTCSIPSFFSSSMSAGMRVRWPAAWDETPMTCTSASSADRATSAGVWNSGPMSTSKPRSARLFWGEGGGAHVGERCVGCHRVVPLSPDRHAVKRVPCLPPAHAKPLHSALPHPVAMTLAPRSWPSMPILATRMRGRRPAVRSKRSTAAAHSATSRSAVLGRDEA